ncbi:hypothetical protein MTR67_044883 [Solanum verrucosum]|uniref:Uncharacterized protein n=1 Tax=Solanum verrucosum TaxID=315347 RepID=A0AAF0ZVN8_SOLVR|nr:hypothetical protein MTR67_044883 [Solanum verrucosum]
MKSFPKNATRRETEKLFAISYVDIIFATYAEYLQLFAISALEDSVLVEALKQESLQLRKKNQELVKDVDHIQEGRCSDVDEVAYLKWINACLRYELRNYQSALGETTARDLSKTLSLESNMSVVDTGAIRPQSRSRTLSPGTKLAHEAMDKVHLIGERFKTTQSRQKSYADVRRRDLEFDVDGWIMRRIGKAAYELDFPNDLASESLSYEEIPVEILDRKVKKLRNKEVASVKVLWSNQRIEGATWEAEADMMSHYSYLLPFDPTLAKGI